MCGIAGMVLLPKKRSAFDLAVIRMVYTEALKNTQDRGTDATGIFLTYKNGKNILSKDPYQADLFTLLPEYYSVINKVNNNTLNVVGHTRAYTQGKPDNNLNNHPIEIDKIVGVHNGSVDNDHTLFTKFSFNRVAEVDSEIIFQLLNNYASNDFITLSQIQKALIESEIRGSFALAFVHKNDPGIVHLIKQSNPLDIVCWNEMGVIFYNSKKEYIYSALNTTERAVNLLYDFKLSFDLSVKEIKEDQYLYISAYASTIEQAISEPREFKISRKYQYYNRCDTTHTTTNVTRDSSIDNIPIFVYDGKGTLISRDDGSGIIDLPWDSLNVNDTIFEEEIFKCCRCKEPLTDAEMLSKWNKENKDELLCFTCQMREYKHDEIETGA